MPADEVDGAVALGVGVAPGAVGAQRGDVARGRHRRGGGGPVEIHEGITFHVIFSPKKKHMYNLRITTPTAFYVR